MPNSINTACLLGHLGGEPRVRQAGDAEVAHVRLATNRPARDAQGKWTEVTEWHDVTIWKPGKLLPLLRKGTRVHVTGSLRTRSWTQDGETRWRTEVACGARDVIVLTAKESATRAEGGRFEAAA